MSEYRWYTLAAVLPVVITSSLEHYRWSVERRDKQRKKAFNKRLGKALDEALAKDRAERDAKPDKTTQHGTSQVAEPSP